ncbi:hypothetical protein DFH29DRAFT_615412 [Suillus ampliporus]|nr:hypothetical protein DFH29DRAFT_615412 [Suillus ampliporus]
MFHQLHCLRRFREALTGQGSSQGHTHHCLNYLRQSTLCQADLTLEAGDFTTWDFTQRRVGATHVCRDWGALYDYVCYQLERPATCCHEQSYYMNWEDLDKLDK